MMQKLPKGIYNLLMKKKLLLLFLIFSAASSKAMVTFDYLFQHPNSHTFATCAPPSQCGGSYLQEYQLIKQELQIISGENNITYDLYEYLDQLDIERTNVVNDIIQKYEAKIEIATNREEEFVDNCDYSTQYLAPESQKCLDYDNYAELKEAEIISISDELSFALNEYKLTREQVDKIKNIGLSLTDVLDELNIDLKKMNESLLVEIETSANYIDEQNRIAEDKRKAEEEKIKAEERRIAEEKRKEEEKIKAEERRIAEEEQKKLKNRKRAQNNPGFRDLKPGLHYVDVLDICPLEKLWDDKNVDSYWHECYGIDNIMFKASYVDNFLDTLTLDMGPITDDGYYLDIFRADDANIYTKMKKSLSDKYELEFEYSERDRQLFNEKEKTSLFHTYSKGQVILEIKWITKDYSKDLRLYIHYLDEASAKAFIEANKPVRATADDF